MWKCREAGVVVCALSLMVVACGSHRSEGAAKEPKATPSRVPEYASLEGLRDSILAMVQSAVAPGDTAVHVSVARTGFHYWYLPDSASGYAVRAVVTTDSSSCLLGEMERALVSRGWAMDHGYSADGPDGTAMGFVTTRYLCVVEGSWDGGDRSDPAYVPAPGCEMTVTCVPRRSGDEPN